ncbi:MAG: glycosyltransferase family 2 protein [bacterium]|nr:glycosyltransferase family 2 protein [bacterium]
MKDVSIIIVNWNAGQCLLDCISSIYRYIYNEVKIEIIVVDNNSEDESVSKVKTEYPTIQIVENKKNMGFAFANNQGFKLSSGEYVLCLNPDTVAQDSSLLKMLEFMRENIEIGITAPKVLDEHLSVCTSVIRHPTLYSELLKVLCPNRKNTRELLPKDFDYEKSSVVECVSGCCMMFRREAVNKIGFFDQDFFMYSEDIEICMRMKKNGYSVFYYPYAQIMHRGAKSAAKNHGIAIHSYISSYIILRKLYGFGISYIYKIFVVFVSIAKIIILAIFSLARNRKYYLFKINNHWHLIAALIFKGR